MPPAQPENQAVVESGSASRWQWLVAEWREESPQSGRSRIVKRGNADTFDAARTAAVRVLRQEHRADWLATQTRQGADATRHAELDDYFAGDVPGNGVGWMPCHD